jgi:hypothetical protein
MGLSTLPPKQVANPNNMTIFFSLILKEVPQDAEQRKPIPSSVRNEEPIEQPIEMEQLTKYCS